MNWWVFGGIVPGIVVLGWLGQHHGLIDLSNNRRDKRGGGVGGALSMGDDVFAPTRHEAAVEVDRQARMPAPAPLVGDGDKGIYDGQIVIDVTKKKEE